MSKFFFLTFISIIIVSFAIAQPPPPIPSSSTKPSSEIKKPFSWGSIRDLPISPSFLSREGRFAVGFKKQISGYSGLSPNRTGLNASGSEYVWKFDDGQVTILFLDFPETDLKGTEDELIRITENVKNDIEKKYSTKKLLDKTYFKLGSVFASSLRFSNGENGIELQRTYLVKNRLYRIAATIQNPDNERFLIKAFDSFKILTKEEVAADIKKEFDAIKPASLPQTPTAMKQTSDLQDERLKGKVKEIILETESLSGDSTTRGRRLSSKTHFNELGNKVQVDYFDDEGNQTGLMMCGYIDGKRVFKSKSISDNTAPPPAMPIVKPNENLPKRDLRYDYSLEYKYVDGQLAEKQFFSNSGEKGNKTVYNYSKNQVERLIYTSEGSLNQKYLTTLDEKGNEIEEINFGLANYKFYGDRKYRYSYEFDKQGNWIAMIATKEVTENGITSFKVAYKHYRTITYW
jgi:hypothetical protein